MAYQKRYSKPYPAWTELPDESTPVTAQIKTMETDTFLGIESYLSEVVDAEIAKIDGKADAEDIPTRLAQLTGDANHRTVTDAQIDSWNAGGSGGGAVASVNGKTGVVVLNAEDVGALPSDTPIPSALADLTEDSTHRTVTDAEKEKWNAGGGGDVPDNIVLHDTASDPIVLPTPQSLHRYSTEEHIVAVDTDGNYIYERTFIVNTSNFAKDTNCWRLRDSFYENNGIDKSKIICYEHLFEIYSGFVNSICTNYPVIFDVADTSKHILVGNYDGKFSIYSSEGVATFIPSDIDITLTIRYTKGA